MPLNFLFKFTGINVVQLNINPVEFHLIRLCSFCNIYMSNDVKFFETPYINIVFSSVLAMDDKSERVGHLWQHCVLVWF